MLLCLVTAIAVVIALVSIFRRNAQRELIAGIIGLVSAIISCGLYYYARIVMSGGSWGSATMFLMPDGSTVTRHPVAFVFTVYIIAGALCVMIIIHGAVRHKRGRTN